MNKIAFWIKNARHISLPQSLLPGFLAAGMAAAYETFSWGPALAALGGVACAHLGMNLLDDYFDYAQESGEKRQKLAAGGIRARMAKYTYLTSGAATVGQLRVAIGLFFLCAAVAGAYVVGLRGAVPLYIALAGAFLGYSYSGGPLRLGYRGYGELLIGLMFGPMLMAGVQYAACGVFDSRIVLVGVAVGLLVTNILYAHSILDRQADMQMGKLTLAGLLKSPAARLAAAAVFTFGPFVLVGLGVALHLLPVACLCVAVLLPLAVVLWRSLWRYTYDRSEPMTLWRWLGPMGDFEGYRRAGIDWFMYRWLMARNLVSFFALILLVVNILLNILG